MTWHDLFFTPETAETIRLTGNIWGHSIEYVYKFTLKIPFGFYLNFSQRSKKNMWGRFGGGWNFKLGIDFGGWDCWILNLCVMSIRFGRRR